MPSRPHALERTPDGCHHLIFNAASFETRFLNNPTFSILHLCVMDLKRQVAE